MKKSTRLLIWLITTDIVLFSTGVWLVLSLAYSDTQGGYAEIITFFITAMVIASMILGYRYIAALKKEREDEL
ncbi:MAG: hypothetical protein Q4G25_10965 [Paracoccus sp. (in: a-proteobacteria)]|nr:hypothetical protein [Paracoccus sp. (in: a-proteobacteria)]